jgi:hypothetical protein
LTNCPTPVTPACDVDAPGWPEACDKAGAPLGAGIFRGKQFLHFRAPFVALLAAQIAQEVQRAQDFGKAKQAALERTVRGACLLRHRAGNKDRECAGRENPYHGAVVADHLGEDKATVSAFSCNFR